MIQNTKCECGHQNHVGTVLCESCGKPLFEDDNQTPLEMRYDGVARRSQKQNPSWLDKVWNFFSSVKIAIYLIIITLCSSAFGTIFPQENTLLIDPSKFASYYSNTYGVPGTIYYYSGLSHTFETLWFKGLLFMIGTSLVICSLDRVLPLYRALNKQQIRKHVSFILRQKVAYAGTLPAGPDGTTVAADRWVEQMGAALRKRGYRIHKDQTALLAEKNRFSRWGPYINHIGLIIFLLAVLMRSIPGWHMDQYIAFPEGDVVRIPDTLYYLKNDKFTVEFYSQDEMSNEFREKGQTIPKKYETKATLYKCTADCDVPGKQPQLNEVSRQDIRVNEPLNYEGLMAYQFDYAETPKLLSVNASLKNKQTGQVYGQFLLEMRNPQQTYQIGDYRLSLLSYYPDFGLDENGLPMTKSNEPNAPAFIFNITGPDLPTEGTKYIYFPRQIDKAQFRQDDINGELGARLEIAVNSMNDVNISSYTSYLNIRVDRAMPMIWVGAAISMIGLVMGFYWQHRRIWLRIDGDELALGAHTNKNWFGMRKETALLLDKAGIKIDPKSLEKGEKLK